MPMCSRAGKSLFPTGTGHWAEIPHHHPFPAFPYRQAGNSVSGRWLADSHRFAPTGSVFRLFHILSVSWVRAVFHRERARLLNVQPIITGTDQHEGCHDISGHKDYITFFIYLIYSGSVNGEFQSKPHLRVELADAQAEQYPFPCIDKQHHQIGQAGFQFQRQCAAVDEAIFIRERSPVRQQLVAPVAGLIPGESRQAQREEERLSPVREEFQVIAALRRELFHRDVHILVVILLVQVFSANHPAG